MSSPLFFNCCFHNIPFAVNKKDGKKIKEKEAKDRYTAMNLQSACDIVELRLQIKSNSHFPLLFFKFYLKSNKIIR